MSNENKTIYEYDFNLIYDFFLNTERQGPGSPAVTLQALSFIDNLTDQSRIADLGCGTGGQTMVLARHAPGNITGVDLFPGFVEQFNYNARKLNLQDRVKGIIGSMDHLAFQEDELDLIWSEGAIYNMGFEKGLTEWWKYIKTDGFIAVTECCWLTNARPDDKGYLSDNYSEIDSISNKLEVIIRTGYLPVAHFVLPENCWTENYYAPLVKAREIFLHKHAGNKAAEDLMAFQQYDEEIYRKYKKFFGYVFFIAKKIAQ